MTERGRAQVRREQHFLGIGPSSFSWNGACLRIDLDEVTAPLPSRIRGQLTLHPSAVISHQVALDLAGMHHWRPIAPCARVEVTLSHPRIRWSGSGYLDSNYGSEPLEKAFHRWDWSRATGAQGNSVVLYDVARRGGDNFSLAQRFHQDGHIEDIVPPPAVALPDSAWRLARGTRGDSGQSPTLIRSLEDGPFYARTLLENGIDGERVMAVHEALSLDRFRSPWVQMLLPFRMPRRA